MTKIIKNNLTYSSGARYTELTQAQYDLLSDAEKHNGKMYFIVDANGDGNNFQPVIYSNTEREIGVWIDGKPLYEQTIYCSALPDNSSTNLTTPSNLELLIDAYGFCNSKTLTGYMRPLPFAAGGTNDIRIDLNDGTLRVVTFSNWSGYDAYIIVRYTKSTDTVGSGTWTPQGVPAKHLSDTEHIIGTWVDGSTLYEKTISLGALPNNAVGTVAHGISNLKMVVSSDGTAYNSSGTNLPLPYISGGSSHYTIDFNVGTTNITITTYTNRSAFTGYLTLQYIKTS